MTGYGGGLLHPMENFLREGRIYFYISIIRGRYFIPYFFVVVKEDNTVQVEQMRNCKKFRVLILMIICPLEVQSISLELSFGIDH